MGFFTCKRFDSFDLVFLDQITDLYTAELRLMDAFAQMAETVSDPRLQGEFCSRLHRMHFHVRRLKRIFDALNLQPVRLKRDAMKGLLAEVQKIIDADGAPEIKDATLIGAVQRIEHYQIAAYRTAQTFAHRIERPDIARWLQATVEEKETADKNLSELAEFRINREADVAVS
jgi:ferritin-like metal-binding protein YciE